MESVRVAALRKFFECAPQSHPTTQGRTEMQNETMGAQSSPYFERAALEATLGPAAPRVWAMPQINHFFVGIDPGSTQSRSDTAVVSACYVRRLGGGVRDFGDDAPLTAAHLVV